MQTLPARFAVRAARIKMKIVVLDGDVINPGDISWAMRLTDTRRDFEFLQ